ncbi:MAG: hypothetical protein ACTSVZ_12020 [Promethearchaeota archaeon]
MKNKTYFALVLLCLTLGSLIFPRVAIATEGTDAETTTSLSYTVEGTHADNNTYRRVAIIPERNAYSDIIVNGDAPAYFEVVGDKNNSLIGPEQCDDVIGYPYNVGQLTYLSDDRVEDPWDKANWLYTNDTENEAGVKNFNVSLSNNILGSLSIGQVTQFDVEFPGLQWMELHLTIPSEGFYMLYFDDGQVFNYKLLSTERNSVSKIFDSLPAVDDSGIDIRDFIAFSADAAGDYILYFQGSQKYIIFEMEKIDVTQKIGFDDEVIYRDETYEGADPDRYYGPTDGPYIHIYEFEVEAGSYLKHNFDLIWGSPYVRLITPSPTGNKISKGINTNFDNDFTQIQYTGKAYLLVLHNNYFSWGGGVLPTNNLLYYKFGVEQITNYEDYTIGGSQLFKIDPNPGVTFIRMTFNETKYALFSADRIVGTPAFDMIDGSPDDAFSFADDYDGILSVKCLAFTNGFYFYRFNPGTYFTTIEFSGGSMNAEILNLTSSLLTESSSLVPKSLTKENSDLLQADKTEVTFGVEENFCEPQIFPVSWDGTIRNLASNTSLFRDDNTFGDNKISFSLKVAMYQQSLFNNLTLKTLGSLTTWQNRELDFGDNESGSYTGTALIGGTSNLPESGEGILIVWPYDVQIWNVSSWIPFNSSSVHFRIGMKESTNYYKYEDLTTVGIVNRQLIDIQNEDNFDALTYDSTYSYNTSLYDGVIVNVDFNGSSMYDWYQIIVNVNDSVESSVLRSVTLYYNNIWTSTSGPGTSNYDTILNTNSLNFIYECGIALEKFSIRIYATNTTDEMVEISLQVNRYNVSTLYAPSYDMIGGGLDPTLLIIGGSAGLIVIVVVGIVFLKKKKVF